jgi:hypothetical protein
MESRQPAAPADPPEPKTQAAHLPGNHVDSPPRDESWFAAPLIAVFAVLCCASPLLLGALAASGAGAWLLAHSSLTGAAALALAALLTWAIRARLSRG